MQNKVLNQFLPKALMVALLLLPLVGLLLARGAEAQKLLNPAEVAGNTVQAEEEKLVVDNDYRKIEFTSEGVGFALRKDGKLIPRHELTYHLAQVRSGQHVYAVTDALPVAEENQVSYPHSMGVTERYIVEERSLEQLFELDEPLPLDGDLEIVVQFDTELKPVLDDPFKGVSFYDGTTNVLHYSGAVVFDADGKETAVPLSLAGHEVTISVPEKWLADATYPVTIDPRLEGSRIDIVTLTSNENNPSVAYSTASGQYLVVFESDTGSGDVMGQYVDGETGATEGQPFYIASSADYEGKPDVVYDSSQNLFFVVWEAFWSITIHDDSYVIKGILVKGENESDNLVGDEITVAEQLVLGDELDYDLRDPAIAFNEDDNIFQVVFRRDNSAIHGQMLSSDSTTPTLLGPFEGFEVWPFADEKSVPDIAWSSAANTFLAVWQQAENSKQRIAIVYLYDTYQGGEQRIGNRWWIAPYDLGDDPLTYDTSNPAVAYDPVAEAYVVVFEHKEGSSSNSRQTIHGQRVRPDYNGSEGFLYDDNFAFPIETLDNETHGYPAIAFSGLNNEMYVAYNSVLCEFGTTITCDYWLYDRTLNGTSVSSRLEVRAAPSDKAAQVPDVACSDGRCLVVWQEQNYDPDNPSDSNWNIYGQRVWPACNPVTSVTIYSPADTGPPGDWTFTAGVSPSDASEPLTYTWSPAPDSGQGTRTATYNFNQTGEQTISVTVTNCDGSGTVNDEHTVTITPGSCSPLTDVTIYSPADSGLPGEWTFIAGVSPNDASEPLTYTWSPAPDSGQGTATANYNFNQTGNQTLSVTVTNCDGSGTANDEHTITITTDSCTSVTGVMINGPTNGQPGEYTFTTNVSPDEVSGPLTYTWSPAPDSGQGTATATYNFSQTGDQTISVTVTNCDGSGTASDSHLININTSGDNFSLFLPIIIRQSGGTVPPTLTPTMTGTLSTSTPTSTPTTSTATPTPSVTNTPTTSTATATPSVTNTPTIATPTTTPTPTPDGELINGDFESGATDWVQYSENDRDLIYQEANLPHTPHSGSWAAWLGEVDYEVAYIEQQVTIPSSQPYLSYWYWLASEGSSCDWDSAMVRINGTDVVIYSLCESANTNGWVQGGVDLSAYAGQSVTLQIRVQTANNNSLFIDDLSFMPTPELINGDFESGATAWVQHSGNDRDLIYQEANLPHTPHSGSWAAWLGEINNEVAYIEQQVTIPSSQPYLSYWYWLASEESGCDWDSAMVRINGTDVVTYSLCESENTNVWVQGGVDLSAYAGQSVTLQIRVETDISNSSSLFIDALSFEANTSTQLINGDFESGATDWVQYSENGRELIYQEADLPYTPHSGSWAAWLGELHNEVAYLEQQVTIPTSNSYLSYWYWIDSEEYCGSDYDWAKVRINETDVVSYQLCGNENTNGWVLGGVDLSAYAGQSVTLQIRVKTDFSNSSSLFIDDLSFEPTTSSTEKEEHKPSNEN